MRLLVMRVVAAIAVPLLLPCEAVAYTTGTSLPGTLTIVNDGPGNQTDPHVSGDLVTYIGTVNGVTGIRYFDLSTMTDHAIPGTGTSLDFRSDVSGHTIVFTRIDGGVRSVWTYDVTTVGPAVEIAPNPTTGVNRIGARIGGPTIAWQDFALVGGPIVAPEIVVYDVPTGILTRLTNDLDVDRGVAVAPTGDVVVWEKCATSTAPCDIWQAVKGGGGWTVSQVTHTGDMETLSGTNGSLVVYGSDRSGSSTGLDIFWTPVAGGTESYLPIVGDQRNPTISGNIVAFEGRDLADASPNWDIYLYDLYARTLYRLTNTPTLDETLNDVSVVGDQVRAVWSVLEADQNVYAFTFTLAYPRIDLQPTSYDFGDVQVGQSVTMRFTIQNVGQADLVVTQWRLTMSDAVASAPPPALFVTLAPGASYDVEVTFTPTSVGTFSGTLFVDSNDPGTPTAQATLSGRGVRIVTPAQQLTDILAYFDQSVAAQTLAGNGSGSSAAGRLGALRNQLVAAGQLITNGDTAQACDQLLDAYQRVDGLPRPPDFAIGPSAASLAAMILDLRARLGCGP